VWSLRVSSTWTCSARSSSATDIDKGVQLTHDLPGGTGDRLEHWTYGLICSGLSKRPGAAPRLLRRHEWRTRRHRWPQPPLVHAEVVVPGHPIGEGART
jgi:hypothetical protein